MKSAGIEVAIGLDVDTLHVKQKHTGTCLLPHPRRGDLGGGMSLLRQLHGAPNHQSPMVGWAARGCQP